MKYNNSRDYLMSFYPKARIFKIIHSLSYLRSESKAKIIEFAVNQYINSLPKEEQERCLAIFEDIPNRKKLG